MTQAEKPETGAVMELPAEEVPGVPGIEKRIVFGPERFWEDYVMRCFTLQSGCEVPLHSHSWPHYVLVLQGRGVLEHNGHRTDLQPLHWTFVPPGVEHSFRASSEEPMLFLCIVPREGDQPPQG